jgi:hypothetical protein
VVLAKSFISCFVAKCPAIQETPIVAITINPKSKITKPAGIDKTRGGTL